MTSVKGVVEITFNEKSLAEMRALTRELHKFNERPVRDTAGTHVGPVKPRPPDPPPVPPVSKE